MTLPSITGEFRAWADAELRYTPSGMAMGTVKAVSNSRKQVDGQWVDDKECWVKVILFKKIAEHAAESITKGTLFTVTGRLQTERWEDKDGNPRDSVEIIADTIGLSMAFAPAKLTSTTEGGQVSRSSTPDQSDPWGTPPQGRSDEPPF